VKVGQAIAEIMKREGIRILCGYPVNHLIEFAAAADIRPIMVRQERIGLHMADAISRMTSGRTLGAFCMQHGPGTENAYGGIAQAYSESVPILVVPMGYPRRIAHIEPNYSAVREMRGVAKSAEPVILPTEIGNAMRRAFSRLRNGRGGPCIVEVPSDLWNEEIGELDYAPVVRARSTPDPRDVSRAASAILEAARPLIYAGTGVHWSEAWAELREFAELIGAPVMTSLGGKSAFPEDHPLALGSGGNAVPWPVHHFVSRSDLIIGIGCSFTETNFGIRLPAGKRVIQSTIEPDHLDKDYPVAIGLLGDAKLTLEALVGELRQTLRAPRPLEAVAGEIASVREAWMAEWRPLLQSNERPLNPYRVISELLAETDPKRTVITHDAGSPRDQLSPFWVSTEPLSYIGWGKTTQLGMGLGLAMGAKLARPDKVCINVWGDAAIGFTGMDFETAVRERIPILSILFNNFSMAIELKVMPISTERYRATDISGDYAAMARAFGGYGERVTEPGEIRPAIRRGLEQVEAGTPALLEFITAKEVRVSKFS
jgi:thiamine pyrophosphate-dependent acetolactate synthase large subunit-like protein